MGKPYELCEDKWPPIQRSIVSPNPNAHLLQKGSGVIVNFSSGWGRSTSPEVATYCDTKWAIEGLTKALAQELVPGLATIPLNPGVINTKIPWSRRLPIRNR